MIALSIILIATLILTLIIVKLRIMARAGNIVSFRPGTAVPGPAVGGAPTIGMAYRAYEGDIAAVDTITNLTAFGGQAQTVQVPQGAKTLERVYIGASYDFGNAVVSVRAQCQVRLLGQGLRGSPHDFNGPSGENQGVTSGIAIGEHATKYEDLNIGVVEGGDLQVQAVLIGEDPGDATISVGLGYIIS